MWSYCLAAVGITGLWLAARYPRTGWWINIGAQGLWFAYGLTTGQQGFLITAVVYAYVYARLLRKTAANRPETPDTPTDPKKGQGEQR
jgi:hypothetical protein